MSSVRRIAVLFSRLSGYMAACLQAVQERYDVELLVVRLPPAGEAPFESTLFRDVGRLHDRSALDRAGLQRVVEEFAPDGLWVSGWFDADYLHVARQVRRAGVPVVSGCDAQWTGSLRQQIGRVIAPWHLHTAIDVLWVAGERQRQLAHRLGYTGTRCWSGCYTCDWDAFAAAYDPYPAERPAAFLYVGRYIERKGLDVLVEAYRRYRTRVEAPWPLRCAGAGPQEALLRGEPGIEDYGFVQPEALPDLLGQAGAFVLPSRREPWGVVVHEAATAGLPLLCSDASGAAVHLLQDGYNGYLFTNGDVEHLAQGLQRITEATHEERHQMSRRSHALSRQYTPARWAQTFVEGLRRLRQNSPRGAEPQPQRTVS